MVDPSVSVHRVQVDGRGFELHRVAGAAAWFLRCPGCGRLGVIDEDQFHGRVSVDCFDEACPFHETHDFSQAVAG